jgi:tetratricopeptide (TPR) repeat protein
MSVAISRLLAGSILCVSLIPLACATQDTEPTTPGTTPPSETTARETIQQAEARTQEQAALEAQQRKFLIDDALQKSRRLVEEGRLEEAESTLLRARDIDADNPELNQKLAQVQELLGRRPGEVRTWAEHMQKLLEILMQKELSEAEQLLADAEKQIGVADYDKAIDNIKKVQLRVSIDDRLKWGDVPQRAKALLERAKAERDVAHQAKREAAEREAYEIAQREEEQARIKRKARIDYLMALGTKAYERRDFNEARRLAEEALREEPTHEMATQLAAASEKAYRDRVTDDYVVQKAREFRRFQEQQQELKIPYTEILTAPDPTYWADISKKRTMATAEEQVRAAKDAETLAVEGALERRLPKGLQFDETSGAYAEVIQALSSMTEVPIVITPEAKEVIDSNSLVLQIQLGQPITLRNFLNLLVDRSDKALAYLIQDGAVLFTTKAKALGTPTLRVHPIADLTFPVTNFAGPPARSATRCDSSSPRPSRT